STRLLTEAEEQRISERDIPAGRAWPAQQSSLRTEVKPCACPNRSPCRPAFVTWKSPSWGGAAWSVRSATPGISSSTGRVHRTTSWPSADSRPSSGVRACDATVHAGHEYLHLCHQEPAGRIARALQQPYGSAVHFCHHARRTDLWRREVRSPGRKPRGGRPVCGKA